MAADTWGLSWGGSTGSWLTSWSSTFVPPTPEPESPSTGAAGRSRRKHRYYVEIDGQQFDVANASEAQQLLARARALAEVAAEEQAKAVEAKVRGKKPRPIKLATPTVTASPELGLDLAPIRQDIARIYDSAAALAELRLLLQRAMEEDEEETLLLLM